MADNPFEIPQQMRDLAEQNIKEAHAAYEQPRVFRASNGTYCIASGLCLSSALISKYR